jgi:uncharacterized protein YecT (DUF1311 family)
MHSRRKKITVLVAVVFLFILVTAGLFVWHYQREKQLYKTSIIESENGNIPSAENIIIKHKSLQKKMLATDLSALIIKNNLSDFLAINEWAIKEKIHPTSNIINNSLKTNGFFDTAKIGAINPVTVYDDGLYDKISKAYIMNSDAIYRDAKKDLLADAELFSGPSLYNLNLRSLFVLNDICMLSNYANTESVPFKKLVSDINKLKLHYKEGIEEIKSSITKVKSDQPIGVFVPTGSQPNKISFYIFDHISNGGDNYNQIFTASKSSMYQNHFYIILRPSEYDKYLKIRGIMTYYTGYKHSVEYLSIVSEECHYDNCVKNTEVHKAYVINRLRLFGRKNDEKEKYNAEMQQYKHKLIILRGQLAYAHALACPYPSSDNSFSSVCQLISSETKKPVNSILYTQAPDSEFLMTDVKKISSDVTYILDGKSNGSKITLVYSYPNKQYFYQGVKNKFCNRNLQVKKFKGYAFYNKIINDSDDNNQSYGQRNKWLQFIAVKNLFYPINIPSGGDVAVCGQNYNDGSQTFRTWIMNINGAGTFIVTSSTTGMYPGYTLISIYRLSHGILYKVTTFNGKINLRFSSNALVVGGLVRAPGMDMAQGLESAIISFIWDNKKNKLIPAYTMSNINRLFYAKLHVKYLHSRIMPVNMTKTSTLLSDGLTSEQSNMKVNHSDVIGNDMGNSDNSKTHLVSFDSLHSELETLTNKIGKIYNDEINHDTHQQSKQLKSSEIKWIIEKRIKCGSYKSDLDSHTDSSLKCLIHETRSRINYLQSLNVKGG